MAAGGYSLFQALDEDSDFSEVLQDINGLPSDSKLTVITNCAFLPWEMLYPTKYIFHENNDLTTREPVQLQDFWGFRFEIECLLFEPKTGEYNPIIPIKAHKAGPLVLSCNLNPTIDKDYANQTFKPVAAQQCWIKGDKDNFLRLDLNLTGKAIAKELNRVNNDATILYLYCHGQSEKPFSANTAEKLEVDEKYYIEPYHLDESRKFIRGAIVFMNSCSSGAFSPLSFSTFLSKFRAKQALGLVATSFPVPSTFAAAFGWKLIKTYLCSNVTLGEALLNLRRTLLYEKNPLGLFYTLQCPMDITAPARACNKEKGK